ncbi:alpha/beta hydrolase family esterase [Caldimonas tepidiphila]|uniref:extracellular catalytic domain type 1 short-chain-length polyhydroxyalkanoate depolymerase n=1 Tax=Caldimonas tepidiphila TaxID=2315841 RepID=UPI000E5B5D9F|nr:PHB depolymerase family esterase [Caldimonas tepidiphila]
MKPQFQELMLEATRLTQAGRLQDASAVIQQALQGGTAAPATPAATEGAYAAAPWASAFESFLERSGAPADTRTVLDGCVREVDEAQQDAPAARGPSGAAGEFIDGVHSEAAGSLHYKLYVPPGHEGKALPLLVMLHGCTQDPDDFAAGTAMNELAREQGFFVLYPAQSQHANPQRCWNWFKHNHQQRGRGEPAVLANLTQAVMRQYGIDPARVYAAGLSAGGAMAAILGQSYPELFAAVGVHSGLPPGAAHDVQTAFAAMREGSPPTPPAARPLRGAAKPSKAGGPVPTIVFHGDRDTTVSPRNGQQLIEAAVGPHALAQAEHGRSAHGQRYTRTLYRSASGLPLGEHWELHGSGHAWSGGSARGSYTEPRGVEASREMLRFFLAHPKEGRKA